MAVAPGTTTSSDKMKYKRLVLSFDTADLASYVLFTKISNSSCAPPTRSHKEVAPSKTKCVHTLQWLRYCFNSAAELSRSVRVQHAHT